MASNAVLSQGGITLRAVALQPEAKGGTDLGSHKGTHSPEWFLAFLSTGYTASHKPTCHHGTFLARSHTCLHDLASRYKNISKVLFTNECSNLLTSKPRRLKQFNVGTRSLVVRSQRDRSSSVFFSLWMDVWELGRPESLTDHDHAQHVISGPVPSGYAPQQANTVPSGLSYDWLRNGATANDYKGEARKYMWSLAYKDPPNKVGADLPRRNRLVRHRSGVREALGSNPG
ncbi:hypothetical protein PR048_024104 [Dryococelus australis]|uniref:Uncharacterized protein n=1 Tax=Dryococelus australis TaxID=614101 RepID=A0ABQ9GVX5_9NEOP|nr:hypothetical protein PR048_024104 [Dryococelus australis]